MIKKIKDNNNCERILFPFIFFVFIFFNSINNAQTRRAFLVGINEYNPVRNLLPYCRKRFSSLSGCINDIEEMAGILEAKYGFEQNNIHLLPDEKATRGNILNCFEKYLINEAAPGDICVFYYSGHGSQVKNSKSPEHDGWDESIVPFDSYRGAKDIRDKELKKLFNRVLDKQAQLTVIVDACHSGSISRGIPSPLRYRFLPPDECDVAELPNKEKFPAQRGALIFSAAQDFELAFETEDENNNSHGLFTWALLNVLRSAPIDELAQNIMLRVNALMHSEGSPQEPNLEGLPEQRMKPLFGIKPGDRSSVTAAVIDADGETIVLQGGIAAGIRENCELKKICVKDQSSEIRLRVNAVQGLNCCTAKLMKGSSDDIQKGDLFEMDHWAAPPGTRMKVSIPASSLSMEELTHTAHEINKLCNQNNIDWINDPTEKNPTHIIFWNNSSWFLHTPTNMAIDLGKKPNTNELIKQIRLTHSNKNTKPGFFFHVPISASLNATFQSEITGFSDSIEILSPRQETNYVLVGRYNDEKLEYAWALPNTVGINIDLPLPVRTKWLPVEKTANSQEPLKLLIEKIMKLAIIKAWLQLSSPPDNGEFPYRLSLKNTKTGLIANSGPLVEGEEYIPLLKADKDKLHQFIEQRYVYMFIIDSDGEGKLIFPSLEQVNSENHFPIWKTDFPSQIELMKSGSLEITSPFGVDTYILLTTTEPIPNPDILNFSGVRRGAPKGKLSPLEKLLTGVGVKRGGNPPVTPTNWSIERLSILSKHK